MNRFTQLVATFCFATLLSSTSFANGNQGGLFKPLKGGGTVKIGIYSGSRGGAPTQKSGSKAPTQTANRYWTKRCTKALPVMQCKKANGDCAPLPKPSICGSAPSSPAVATKSDNKPRVSAMDATRKRRAAEAALRQSKLQGASDRVPTQGSTGGM